MVLKAIKVMNKMKGKLKFLCRKNVFLTSDLLRMLCNALIQPDFDANLTEKKQKRKYKLCKINAYGFALG